MQLKPIADRRLARIRGRARAACARPTYAKRDAYCGGVAAAAASEPVYRVDERRRHSRVGVQATVMIRRIGAFSFNVVLKDISAGGCRVVMLEPSAVGDPVIARLPQLEPLGSRVCWAEATSTGVQFLKTIHPAVFDLLLTRLSGDDARAA
jgi:hypothetical protein